MVLNASLLTQEDTEITVQTDCGALSSAGVDDEAWNAFVASTPGGSYHQTSYWARVKTLAKLRVSRVLVKQEGHVVAGAQMFIKSARPFTAAGYVPLGPVLAPQQGTLVRQIIESLDELAHRERLGGLVVQPPAGAEDLAVQLQDMGFSPTSLELAPTATILIDLSRDADALMTAIHRSSRQNIRAGKKKGTVVREGGEDDLPTFHRLLTGTARRQGFTPASLDYYRNVWQVMASRGLLRLFFAEVKGESVSAAMLIPFGGCVVCWRRGWSGAYLDHHTNEVIQWHLIQWAKRHGYRYFDSDSIEPNAVAILRRGGSLVGLPQCRRALFKSRFGGDVVTSPAALIRFYNPLLRWGYHAFPAVARSGLHIARRLHFLP